MCGIAGVFDLKARRDIAPARLNAMSAAIAPRGPDGSGAHYAPGAALAHRRLAIIDLEGGAQPMLDDEIALVFNGEIYNFQALRAELQALGHRFRTNSDSECLIHGWRQWRARLQDHLDGFFAAAIYDEAAQSLYLMRDRWGKKPLYYSFEDGFFLFASTASAIKAGLSRAPDLREEALIDYLSYGYVPEPKSIYQNIHKLPPAHIMRLERGEAAPDPRRYWRAHIDPTERSESLEEAAEALQPLLESAVASRMIADAPLGVFLSSGVDSAAMLALASKARGAPLIACTMGFDDSTLDESNEAAQMAARYGAIHHIERADAATLRDIDGLARAFDEPFADASALPMLALCRLASNHMKVALSGDGGDELFAGYRRYPWHLREERLKALAPLALRRAALGPLARACPALPRAPRFMRPKATLEALAGDQMDGLFRATAIIPPQTLAQLLSLEAKRRLKGYDPAAQLRAHARTADTDDPLARAQYVDLNTWLPGRMLVKTDRASMAAGLEMRNPLLDLALAERVMRLPTHFKLRGHEGKILLKSALARHAPPEILRAPKRGFVAPLARWMRGPWAARLDGLAASNALMALDLLNPPEIERLWRQTKIGAADHSRALWALMMLEAFLQTQNGQTALTEAA